MVQVRVAGVAMDAAGGHVILLKPVDDPPGQGSILPIWIGAQEATSILIAVEGAELPRPLAHDLMRSLLTTLDAEVVRVEVSRVDDGTFYADITVRSGDVESVVDARPSDAVALASRTGSPMWVADAVMADAGVPDTITNDSDGDAEARVEEFKAFLEDVDPEDFRE